MVTALEVLLSDDKVKVLLINIFGGITRCDEVAEGLLPPSTGWAPRCHRGPPGRHQRGGGAGDHRRARAGQRRGGGDHAVGRAGERWSWREGGRHEHPRRRATRLVVQGITGREGAFHATRNKAYGTQVVAGVTPGKAGQDVDGIPVFNTVEDAVEATGANTAMVFVPPRFAADAILEALDSRWT